MNEFQKDEIIDEEDNSLPETEKSYAPSDPQEKFEEVQGSTEETQENTDEAQDKDELTQELENIRDMFQEELDKAAEENTDGLIIQDLEDVDFSDEDEEEIPEEELCECCGENRRSEDYGEDYPYCESCRNLMKKYPLRAGGIIMMVLMLAVFVGSLYLSYPYMEDTLTVADASSNYHSGYSTSALQGYYAYFNGNRSENAISKRALREFVDGYVNAGYHTDATTLIQSYYDENTLKLPWNKKYADVIDEATILTETYNAVYEVTYDALYGDEYDYDTVMADLEALKEVNPVEKGTSETTTKYDEVFIEYYKYVLMSVHGDTPEAQLEQLKKIDALGEGYEWVYLSNYCAIAARCGDEEAVNYAYDRLIELNVQDANAYISKASYYRYLDEPDADKMIELCTQASEVVSSSDYSYKHTLAIAYLLKDEGALALEEISALFSAGSYTVQNCNLYALCGLYNGDESVYDDMSTLLTGYGYEISDLVTEYKDGKITIEEALKDKGGDI